jgi:phosphoglycolate phosphatase
MRKNHRYDLIVFDWDGTLFDSTALIVRCIQNACQDLGLPRPTQEQAAYVIGLGLNDALRHAVPDLPATQYPELSQRYRRHYFAAQHEISLFEGCLAMLNDLKSRQHWLGIATGKSRRGLDEALAHVDLKGLFDATRTADETLSKPDPLMLLELMDELSVVPEQVLMIGDTTHDLRMAQNAGVASVAVAYGAHDRESFSEYAPLYVAPSTPDLHEWLIQNASWNGHST